MANIKDVARLAGVSVSTVSNILNQKISVSQELHQRVIQAMRELDYHPNFLAMNLRKKSINFIGVIVSSLSGHYHQIYDGINQVAREARCQPILKIAKSPKEEHRQIEELLQLNVSGIIIISSNLDRGLIQHYTDAGIPVVFADFYPSDSEHNTVRFDNYHIVRGLTQTLMAGGKRTALITGNSFLGSEEDCIRAYLESLDPAVQRGGNPVPDGVWQRERFFRTDELYLLHGTGSGEHHCFQRQSGQNRVRGVQPAENGGHWYLCPFRRQLVQPPGGQYFLPTQKSYSVRYGSRSTAAAQY